MMSAKLAGAIAVTEEAMTEARRHFRGQLGIEFKADESPVTHADKAVEALVRDLLAARFPDHGIIGEEQGTTGADRAQMWIIDPIDGTRSFLSGHPLFGFLLGHLNNGTADIGIVAMPALDEIFAGVPGAGATLNSVDIHVSDTRDLSRAILCINEGEKIYQAHPEVFDRLTRAGQTRRFAYDCYPHALVAAGHVDAVVDYDLQPYDYMPVLALVTAAGGVMTDWQGAPLTLQSDGCVITAATPELHRDLLRLLKTEGS